MKKVKILLSIVLGCVAFSLATQAQPSAGMAVQQQENAQQNANQQQLLTSLHSATNAPEMYEGESADVGPQHILRLVPHRTHFSVKADSQYLYTDNVLLAPAGIFPGSPKVSGTIFINTLCVAYAPEAFRLGNGRFAPSAGVQTQFYDYGLGGHSSYRPSFFTLPMDSNNFDVQTIFVGAKYLTSGGWTLSAELDYNRFLFQNDGQYFNGEIYHDFSPMVGATRVIKLQKNAFLSLNAKADLHKSHTMNGPAPDDSNDRIDLAVGASLNWQVLPRVVLQPYYRLQYSAYRYDTSPFPYHYGRSDFLHSIGVSAAYYFTPNLSLRGFVNEDVRMSDDDSAQYKALGIGANLTYSIRF